MYFRLPDLLLYALIQLQKASRVLERCATDKKIKGESISLLCRESLRLEEKSYNEHESIYKFKQQSIWNKLSHSISSLAGIYRVPAQPKQTHLTSTLQNSGSSPQTRV